ncbi:MAG: hypothetical protein P4L99_22780, partial [Chthoniobacter sp.]|nr:hypothetical protein [Chthoniobacter sp.]
ESCATRVRPAKVAAGSEGRGVPGGGWRRRWCCAACGRVHEGREWGVDSGWLGLSLAWHWGASLGAGISLERDGRASDEWEGGGGGPRHCNPTMWCAQGGESWRWFGSTRVGWWSGGVWEARGDPHIERREAKSVAVRERRRVESHQRDECAPRRAPYHGGVRSSVGGVPVCAG